MAATNFLLRELTAADEPCLWEMLYYAIYVPEHGTRPPKDVIYHPELARYVQHWGQPGDMGCAAISADGSQPIGAAWLRLLCGEDQGYGYIDELTPELTMAVLPGYRGHGIGTTLLRQLQSMARQHYAAISLSVAPGNPARRLYQRLGFQPVARRGSSLTMRLALRRA